MKRSASADLIPSLTPTNIARVINAKPGTIVSQPSPITLITY